MPFMNLTQLQTELRNRLKTNSSAVSNARIADWLNQAQDEIALMLEPEHLIETQTVSTVASTRKYYLPCDYLKILAISDTTSNISLDQVSESDIEICDPKLTDTGTPYVWAVYGYESVRAQPSTAGTISIVSSSASDTTGKVRINGVVGSINDTELLTLNGTTTVTGTKSFSSVHTLAKDSTTIGGITVTSNGAPSATLAIISPNAYVEERQPFYLYPIPSAVLTYRVRNVRRPRQLINSQDFPDFPTAFHEMILLSALVRGHSDLLRPVLANAVRSTELAQAVQNWRKNNGSNNSSRSYVIRGNVSSHRRLARYPYNYPEGQ